MSIECVIGEGRWKVDTFIWGFFLKEGGKEGNVRVLWVISE